MISLARRCRVQIRYHILRTGKFFQGRGDGSVRLFETFFLKPLCTLKSEWTPIVRYDSQIMEITPLCWHGAIYYILSKGQRGDASKTVKGYEGYLPLCGEFKDACSSAGFILESHESGQATLYHSPGGTFLQMHSRCCVTLLLICRA